MPEIGRYLYGFTRAGFRPPSDLKGLAGAPIEMLTFDDIAAVVSQHRVSPLMPVRSNLEPHHRVVRGVSLETTLLPAAFGHITSSDRAIVDVLQLNYQDLRQQLDRLHGKCEMGVKLSWKVGNIFEYFVAQQGELRTMRDRVFSHRDPSLPDKLRLGELFAKLHSSERDRLSGMFLAVIETVCCEWTAIPPREERTICQSAVLIERARGADFAGALQRAARLFDANFAVEYSGPWPAYSFVQLRLQHGMPIAAA